LPTRDFEIAQRNLQTVQLDKLRTQQQHC